MHRNTGNRVTAFRKITRKLAGPTFWISAAALALTIGVAAQSQQQPPSPADMQGKTAAQYYKNIQVLKDVPASQLLPGMRYITTALGVRCDYCHVEDNFPADDKRPKQTARQMMTMLFAIN